MSESRVEALDPRSARRVVEFVPLASRPVPDRSRFLVVRSMPPGSGVGAVAEAVASELRARYPHASVEVFQREHFMADNADERHRVSESCDVAIYVAGPAATMVAIGMQFASGLEAVGTPCSVVVFEPIAQTIESAREPIGARVRTSLVASPPRSEEQTRTATAAAIAAAVAPLSADETRSVCRGSSSRGGVLLAGSEDELQDALYERHLSDGLPVVVPTKERMETMLAGTSRSREEIVTESMRPLGRRLTVETVALNAVMAGAKPELLPFILAASSILGDIQFESMTRSVNSFAFAQYVTGPRAQAVGFNGGLGALGPGIRANSTTGRALGLVVRNGGGGLLGTTSTPTQGNAATWSLVFTENPDSPWEPKIRDRGYGPERNTLSLYTGAFSHAGAFYYSDLAEIATTLSTTEYPANGAIVMLSLKRARLLADQGLKRSDVEAYLYERCTTTLRRFRGHGFFPAMRSMLVNTPPGSPSPYPISYLTDPDDTVVPLFPEDGIEVMVVGDDSSAAAQVWWLRHHRTVDIDEWN